ncbi:MAG: hypothetical protein AAFN93_22340 [Bacteroidota bacterium]
MAPIGHPWALGKNPFHYDIHDGYRNPKVIQEPTPGRSKKFLYINIRWMAFLKRVIVYPCSRVVHDGGDAVEEKKPESRSLFKP